MKHEKPGTITVVRSKTYITRENGQVVPFGLASKLRYLHDEVARVKSIPLTSDKTRRAVEARLAELQQKIDDAERRAVDLNIRISLDYGALPGGEAQ